MLIGTAPAVSVSRETEGTISGASRFFWRAEAAA
jgi:hypothetical protein